jgi:hypothetical protein
MQPVVPTADVDSAVEGLATWTWGYRIGREVSKRDEGARRPGSRNTECLGQIAVTMNTMGDFAGARLELQVHA